MILAIDIGNTNIVVGCIHDDEILFTERMSTDSNKTVLEYVVSIKTLFELYNIPLGELTGSIISSVVPPVTNTIREAIGKITHRDVMVVGPGIKTGINILTDNPAATGSDLIVDAVAAISKYPCPLIIFDFGTATTASVVDKKKNYLGGMILPGLRISLDALTNRTSQLPRISLKAPKKAIGTNTVDCMTSGILFGNAAMLDGVVERIEEELGEKATVIATGGLAGLIVPLCKQDIILDDNLLLQGLNLLYKKNTESK